MATKKPTAKQLAARAKFSAMAKSGALAKKRKAAARKPKPRTKAQDLAIAMSEKRAGHPRKAKEFFERAARAKNPAKKRTRKIPAGNSSELFWVVDKQYSNTSGPTGGWSRVGYFEKEADATTFAHHYADSKMVAMRVYLGSPDEMNP